MSEETTDTAPAGETTTPAFEAITSQEALDKIVGTRLARERSKFADYDELKSKAAEFDKAEETTKSEIQKAIERAEAAEKRLQEQSAESERLRVIAKHGIPAEFHDLIVGSGEQLEQVAEKVAALISKPSGPIVRTEGKQPTGSAAPNDWLREQFRK